MNTRSPIEASARRHWWLLLLVVGLTLGLLTSAGIAEPLDGESQQDAKQPTQLPFGKPPGPELKQLSPRYGVWVDTKRKQVVAVGEVCLREGPLELFACLKGTKEHEAVVAVDAEAHLVHAGLLAVGGKPGSPAVFQPDYRPASGEEIDVHVYWTDDKSVPRRARAQDWIREHRSGKGMTDHWVFAGSRFWKDEATGMQYYLAEDGDLICVSNFPSATLDVPVESSQSNDQLLFEAWTERIPALGTPVTIVLAPRPAEKVRPADEKP